MALSDNLQGWWCPSLDTAGNGTTTLTDLSGNGNDGTLTNMDAATDWVADTDNGGVRALELNGSSQYINIPDGSYKFAADDSGTISMWVRYDSLAGFPVIYSKGAAGPREFVAYNNATYLRASAATQYPDVRSGLLSTGVWYHFAYTLDGTGTQKLYVDGVLVDTNSNIAAFVPRTAPLEIGAASSQALYLTGRWDAFALYHRALTADEVTQLYNGGRSLNLLSTGATIVPQLLLRRRRLFGGLVI